VATVKRHSERAVIGERGERFGAQSGASEPVGFDRGRQYFDGDAALEPLRCRP